ncbi:MAG: PHP domain-containing protein [Lachnospiraceae bacterium]
MYIDFHTHGKLAKKLPFSTIYTDWLFGEAKDSGLDAICLTEHFNTLQFEQMYKYIMESTVRDKDTLVAENGLRIFTGMETDIEEGGHILCVGIPEEILELNKRLEPFKEKGKFLSFKKLMELFSEYNTIVGAAHPFREGGHIPELSLEDLKGFDFIDLNGKDIAQDRKTTEEKTYGFGKMLGIPVVSGSDTHQAVQYGCIRTNIFSEKNTVQELYNEIKEGHYNIEVSDNAAFQVKTAGMLKKALKEIHAAGGDYVSVLVGE